MFGYVTADKPNMLIKDYAEYRAYYCGLCKTIGKQTGHQFARFFINYDITFLTLLAHNYQGVKPVIKEEKCIAHMLGKKFAVVQNDRVQEVVADVNTILGYYKLEDNVLDEGELKYKALKALVSGMYEKAAGRYPELAKSVKSNYERLRNMESESKFSLDKAADTFGSILIAVGRTAAGKTADDLLDILCFALGRWIYIIDAYDDLAKDIKEGKSNPLVTKGEALTEVKKEEIYNLVKAKLDECIATIRSAYDRMEINISEGALSNVIYCGLRARTEEVLNSRGEKCKKTLLSY